MSLECDAPPPEVQPWFSSGFLAGAAWDGESNLLVATGNTVALTGGFGVPLLDIAWNAFPSGLVSFTFDLTSASNRPTQPAYSDSHTLGSARIWFPAGTIIGGAISVSWVAWGW